MKLTIGTLQVLKSIISYPTDKWYVVWLFCVTMAFMYNAISLTLRAAFTRANCYDDRPIVTLNASYMMTTMSPETISDLEQRLSLKYGHKGPCAKEFLVIPGWPRYKEGYETDENRIYWWMCDYLCDFLYLIDLLFIKRKIRVVKDGIPVVRNSQCRDHNRISSSFYLV